MPKRLVDESDFYEDSPYIKLDNDAGYDQSEYKGLMRNYRCGYCYGSLMFGHHPAAYTFTVSCRNPDCPGDTIVNKYYLEAIERNEVAMTDLVESNMRDFENFMKKLEDL